MKLLVSIILGLAIVGAACAQTPEPARQDTLLSVKSKTDELPADPAAVGSQMALTAAEENALQAKILSDGKAFSGANIDASISSRAAAGAQMALTPAEETAIQSKILSDGKPFSGAAISALATAAPVITPTVIYMPELQSTNNLTAGPKTISATAEASGLANADYSASLTIPAAPDPRIVIMGIAARQSIRIDSFAGASRLFARVYVDVQDADHRLFDMDLNQTSIDSIRVKALKADTIPAVFNALKDGSAHKFYWFLWVDSGNATISSAQLWEGVGSTTYAVSSAVEINHTGLASLYAETGRAGEGNTKAQWAYHDTLFPISAYFDALYCTLNGLVDRPSLQVWSDGPADIVVVRKLAMVLRTN